MRLRTRPRGEQRGPAAQSYFAKPSWLSVDLPRLRCYAGLADFNFSNDVTVRFAETDAQGIAHHAAYLVWFETTRIEYLRRFRGGYLGLREEGVDALTLEAHARYLSAARFDDRLTIFARCGDLRGARFRFDYAVERNEELIAEGWTTHACVSGDDHRPTRVPPWLAEAIADAES